MVERVGRDRATLSALTGLRFVAALFVVVSHFPELVPVAGLRAALQEQGAAGVTVFFVLSGFVLTYNYAERFAASRSGGRAYAVARLARIMPMNAVALVLITPVVLAVGPRPPAYSWPINLLGLQSLVPVAALHGWNTPAWSISTELAFYAAFPFFAAFVLVRLRSSRSMVWVLTGMLVAEVVMFAVLATLVDRSGKSPEDATAMLERYKFFPGLRIGEFFAGCILGLAYLTWQRRASSRRTCWDVFGRRRNRDLTLLIVIAAAAVVLGLAARMDPPPRGLGEHFATAGSYTLYAPIGVLLVAALAWGPTMISGVLDHPWMQRLGAASYSLYLLQWTAFLLLTEYGPSPRLWWASGLVVVLLIVASLGATRYIEEPCRRWIRRSASGPTDTARLPTDVGTSRRVPERSV